MTPPGSTPAGNRTSQAAYAIQFFDSDNLKNPFDINLKAILEKFRRMQAALEWLRENPTAYIPEQQEVIKDAIEYDPLQP